MRTSLIFITILIGLSSCDKKVEADLNFYGSPEQRMSDSLEFVRNRLVGAPNGWKGGFATGLKGGYGFYFTFKENQEVEMLSDFSNETAQVPSLSTYRVSPLFSPTLVFDTYNYISLMYDPVPGVANGKAGEGFQSDIEFLYERSNRDTLFFKGKKYEHPFFLVEATAQEKQLFVNDGINAFKNAFAADYNDAFVFPYIGDPINRLSISIDNGTKNVSFSYIDGTGDIDSSTTSSFFYTPSEVHLANFVPFNGKSIKSFILFDGKVKLTYTDGSLEDLLTQSTPLFSIESAFAYNKTYKRITGDDAIPGVTADVHIFDRVRELFTASGRNITSMYFGFTNSTTATFYIDYTSGSTRYIASATYDYRREGNTLFVKRASNNGNWSSRSTQVKPVNDILGDGSDERELVIDWVSSADNSVKFPIIGISPVHDRGNLIYGRLGE